MSDGPSHLMPVLSRAAGGDHALCGRHWDDAFPQTRVDHAQAHIDGRGMPVCPECITVTGWACRRCGHLEQPPELFSPYPVLTVAACTRCVLTDQPEEVTTP